MCQKQDFVAGVKNVWDNQLVAVVDYVSKVMISQYYSKIEGSAVANAIRWNIYGTTDVATIKAEFKLDVDYVKNYTTARATFLTNNFGTVQIQDVKTGFFDKILMSAGTAINNAFEWFIVTFNLENKI